MKDAIGPQRRDGAAVGAFLLALARGSVGLAFQPVQAVAGRGGEVLYHEALTRQYGGGQWLPCGETMLAMERLGCIVWYDRLVLNTVIDLLEAHPGVRLGCNLSSLSLRLELGWRAILARLRRNGSVARRLTLEITETAALQDPDEALSIIAALRRLACRVAIDDLGSGRTALAFVRDCRPEVIKIDRSILAPAPGQAGENTELLAAMVGLGTRLSPCVVVEGIDSEGLLRRAVGAGATAVQGFFIAAPEMQPGWLATPVRLRARRLHPAEAPGAEKAS
ncbi:EAL domain-containing protein [Pseudothauera nasutitermitis]|nr:EAL domain-containing protein [Pseudothauera nasutitermitis]